MDAVVNDDGTMHEIVGESGQQTGEGCLRDIAVVGASAIGLAAVIAAGIGGLVWALN